MSVLKDVCALSCEKWVDSFPVDVPEHEFSNKHKKIINNAFNDKVDKKAGKPSAKNVKIILIAAVLLALTVSVVATPTSHRFIVRHFPDHAEYIVYGFTLSKTVKSLTVGYVPEGFVLEEEGKDYRLYRSNDKEFLVRKSLIKGSIGFDTEYGCEIILINGIEAVNYESHNNFRGIIFNDGAYIFMVDGNVPKNELVKIAQNIQ